MKINKLLVALFITLFTQCIVAQNNTRSPYSVRAFGELEPFESAFNKALGGNSNGIRSSRFISFANPASVSALGQVSVDFGFHVTSGKYFSSSAANTYYNGNFSYFTLGFPLYRKEIAQKDTSTRTGFSNKKSIIKSYRTIWAAAMGITPFSNIGASYFKNLDTTYGSISNYYNYSGGLNRFFVMNGVNVNKNLSLGLNTSLIFGQIKNQKIYLLNDTFVGRATSDLSLYQFTGFKFDFGFQWVGRDTFIVKDSIKKVLDSTILNNKKVARYINVERIKKLPLRITYGANVNNNAALNYNLTRTALNISNYFTNAAVDTLINQNNVKGKTYLPSGFSAGFSLHYNNKWMVAFDYKSDLLANIKKPLFNDVFTNSAQFSIGFAYKPDLEPELFKTRQVVNKNKRFKTNLEYRFGFRSLNSGYNFKDNQGVISPLKEYGISFGIGIPKLIRSYNPQVPYLKNMINITGEYIHRGTTKNGMIEENLYKVTLGFTLNDNWFVKRKFN